MHPISARRLREWLVQNVEFIEHTKFLKDEGRVILREQKRVYLQVQRALERGAFNFVEQLDDIDVAKERADDH